VAEGAILEETWSTWGEKERRGKEMMTLKDVEEMRKRIWGDPVRDEKKEIDLPNYKHPKRKPGELIRLLEFNGGLV